MMLQKSPVVILTVEHSYSKGKYLHFFKVQLGYSIIRVCTCLKKKKAYEKEPKFNFYEKIFHVVLVLQMSFPSWNEGL